MTDITLCNPSEPMFTAPNLEEQTLEMGHFLFLMDWWSIHPHDGLALIGLCAPDCPGDPEKLVHQPLPSEVRRKVSVFSKIFVMLSSLMQDPDYFDDEWFVTVFDDLDDMSPLDCILSHGYHGITMVHRWLGKQAARQFLDRLYIEGVAA